MNFIAPMKAALILEPFNDKDWVFEIKWDGYRIIAAKEGNIVNLWSRNQKVFNDRFPQIVQDIKTIEGNFILDGEVIVLANGKPSFQMIQNKENGPNAMYVVFDILSKNAKDLTDLTFKERKSILYSTVPNKKYVSTSGGVPTEGIALFNEIKKLGLEGIVAKKADSTYEPGKRSKNWLKIKNIQQEEVVIIGYTKSEKGNPFGALLLGQYIKGKLGYVGKVGTGFTEEEAKNLKICMDKLRVARLSVNDLPPKLQATLIRPKLVAEISYTEKTGHRSFRHPSFLGLREDKNAQDVQPEKPINKP